MKRKSKKKKVKRNRKSKKKKRKSKKKSLLHKLASALKSVVHVPLKCWIAGKNATLVLTHISNDAIQV